MLQQPTDLPTSPVELIATLNQDIIHDISFDWYGKRIATCSSDKTISIYCKNNEGKWDEQAKISVQGGPLWRVKWARPEFGLIIATCSLDRSVKIFEKKKNKWIEQTKISDSKEGIEDIKFSPRHALGLFLASSSADGNLRIYEAQDPTNLKNWMLKHTIPVNDLGLNCLSWNKSQVDKMMIAVGCKDLKTTHKKTMLPLPTQQPTKSTLQFIMAEEMSWVPLSFPYQQKQAINDVSWALMNGRSYHLAAMATDTLVRVFYLKMNEKERAITIEKKFELLGCGMRLSWNVMGTSLAVSEPKRIRIYKSEKSIWREVNVIQEKSQE